MKDLNAVCVTWNTSAANYSQVTRIMWTLAKRSGAIFHIMQLIGQLGQDPDVQYSDKGTARTTFSVATHRTWTDTDGQLQTETEWTRCATWGKLAEISAQ